MDVAGIADAFDLPDVSDETAAELSAQAQAGDLGAREELVHSYLRMAKYMAQSFTKGDPNYFEDCFQIACETLVTCVDRYDPGYGPSFKTWAAMQLRYAIWKYLLRVEYRFHETRELYAIYLQLDPVSSRDHAFEMLRKACDEAEVQGLIDKSFSETFLMHASGATQAQIGQKLGIHRNTIRQRCMRVFEALLKDRGFVPVADPIEAGILSKEIGDTDAE